jgi:hypothetical protein
LKRNVTLLSGALDKLLQLRGVNYEWIEPKKHGNLTGKQMGMIAQEVEKVFPEWVGTNPDGFKNLTFRGFEALTVEALRELKTENEALQRTNDLLQSQIAELQAAVTSLAAAKKAESNSVGE